MQPEGLSNAMIYRREGDGRFRRTSGERGGVAREEKEETSGPNLRPAKEPRSSWHSTPPRTGKTPIEGDLFGGKKGDLDQRMKSCSIQTAQAQWPL